MRQEAPIHLSCSEESDRVLGASLSTESAVLPEVKPFNFLDSGLEGIQVSVGQSPERTTWPE